MNVDSCTILYEMIMCIYLFSKQEMISVINWIGGYSQMAIMRAFMYMYLYLFTLGHSFILTSLKEPPRKDNLYTLVVLYVVFVSSPHRQINRKMFLTINLHYTFVHSVIFLAEVKYIYFFLLWR